MVAITLVQLALLAVGLAVLTAGAEGLVRGGSRLATRLGVSPLVVGLTIVSIGTSAPELVVSVVAAYEGQDTLAVGNVIGSNVFNAVGVLGPTALVLPIVVHANVVRREIPVMLGAYVVFLLGALDGIIARGEGLIMLAAIALYVWTAYRFGKEEPPEIQEEFRAEVEPSRHPPIVMDIALVVGGLALLVVGGRVAVGAAVAIASAAGVSERVIALTLVAIGTSLPELVTSVVAAFRGHADMAVGNVVGSSVFNVLGIAGAAALLHPLRVLPEALRFDLPVMLASGVAIYVVARTGHRVSRLEGAVLVVAYVAYVAAVLLDVSP